MCDSKQFFQVEDSIKGRTISAVIQTNKELFTACFNGYLNWLKTPGISAEEDQFWASEADYFCVKHDLFVYNNVPALPVNDVGFAEPTELLKLAQM